MFFSPQGRPTWLEIDLSAIVHNYRVAQRAVGQAVKVWPVVKANGYGLGAIPIALALQEVGAPGFCVTMVEEALPLRQAGITRPIILLSGVAVGQEREVIAFGLQPFVFTLEDGQRLARNAPSAPIFLKINSGMGRLGFSPEEGITALTAWPELTVAGITSHLACADQRDHPATNRQIARIRQMARHPQMRGLPLSLANSAGILGHPTSHFDWVRPGIMLYGASPFFPAENWRENGLRPVVHWYSRIIQIQEMPPGTPLGYGHTFVTRRPSRMAWIPVGYDDGYSRILGNRGQVLVAGQRAPVVGRVCMDLIAIDITDIPAAATGSLVTLLGEEGAECIDVEEMAGWMETIPYELLCRLGERVPRHYFDSSVR